MKDYLSLLVAFYCIFFNIFAADNFFILGKTPKVTAGYVIDNIALAKNGTIAESEFPFIYEGNVMDSYKPYCAIDGDKDAPASRWISFNKDGEHSLILNFGKRENIFSNKSVS